MKVILRPLLKDNWAGVIRYKNCYEDIKSYFTRSGTLYTGLTDDEAKRLGEKLGLDLGRNSEYWRDFFIRTQGKDIILDTEDPMDELKYLFCKNHKYVKESIFQHKATAKFVLVNPEEESKKTNLFNRLKREAIREFDKMTPEEMRKALRIYGKSAENMSPEVVENRLYEIVESDPEGFITKWVRNTDRETQYLIERAISMNIIRKNKRLYTYGTDTIGHGLEETIAFLKDPKNQDLRITITKAVEGKSPIDYPTVPKLEPTDLREKPKHNVTLRPTKEVKEELAKK